MGYLFSLLPAPHSYHSCAALPLLRLTAHEGVPTYCTTDTVSAFMELSQVEDMAIKYIQNTLNATQRKVQDAIGS